MRWFRGARTFPGTSSRRSREPGHLARARDRGGCNLRAWITFRCKVERDDEKEFYLSIGSNPLMVLPVSALCAALCVLFAVLVGSNSLANLIWTAILLGSFAAAFIIIAFNIRRHLVYQRKEGKLLMITALRSHPISKARRFDLSDIEAFTIDVRAERNVTRGIPSTVEFYVLSMRTREHGNVDLVAGRDARQLQPVKDMLDGAMLAGRRGNFSTER